MTFFDLERLAAAVGWDDLDDLDDLVHRREPRPVEFSEKNVIVIPALTEEAVEQAVGDLARAHAFDWLLE